MNNRQRILPTSLSKIQNKQRTKTTRGLSFLDKHHAPKQVLLTGAAFFWFGSKKYNNKYFSLIYKETNIEWCAKNWIEECEKHNNFQIFFMFVCLLFTFYECVLIICIVSTSKHEMRFFNDTIMYFFVYFQIDSWYASVT